MSEASPTERSALLSKAVACYWKAQRENDACRCLEQLGDFGAAAALHERAQRWVQAASCFEQAGQWSAAARCYRQAGMALEAANCYRQAGDMLEAGWMLAHEAHRYGQARAVLAKATLNSAADILAHGLALARCTAATERVKSGAAVRQAVLGLPGIAPGAGRERILIWAMALAEVLDRPDLSAQIHALEMLAGMPSAGEDWERWAMQRLGDVTGNVQPP